MGTLRTLSILVVAAGAWASGRTTRLPVRSSLKDRLVGSWKLISRRSERTNGEPIADPGLAATPSGMLIYDNLGHVAVQLARQGRTIEGIRNECGTLATMQTSPNTANTALGYDAYYGTYTLNEKDGIVTHHLEAAVWPGNVGYGHHQSRPPRG